MRCNDVRTFFSQIAEKSISIQISQSDMDFLSNGGYLSVMQKGDYDNAAAEVANLTQMNADLGSRQEYGGKNIMSGKGRWGRVSVKRGFGLPPCGTGTARKTTVSDLGAAFYSGGLGIG